MSKDSFAISGPNFRFTPYKAGEQDKKNINFLALSRSPQLGHKIGTLGTEANSGLAATSQSKVARLTFFDVSEGVLKPSEVAKPKAPEMKVVSTFTGQASYYADGNDGFHGQMTANGETMNGNALTAAHRTLPFGTLVRVTNMEGENKGKSQIVRINDRGPYSGNRVIDLSFRAAKDIGMVQSGHATVKIEVLEPASTQTASK